MAASWFKSLIRSRKSKPASAADEDHLRSSALSKSKRWVPWKTLGSGKGKERSPCGSARFVQLKDLQYVHGDIEDFKAWTRAAVSIQCAFRRLLARRALKALRAIVRIQAIVRGRRVRRQVAESREILKSTHLCDIKKKEWCDHQGSLQEIEARQQHKHDAAMKRERALAYALSLQAGDRKSRSKFWQLWQSQLTGLDRSPELAMAYYYSGAILTPLTTPSPSSSPFVHKDLHNFKDCSSVRRPGYMEATMSMRAKFKSNLGNGNMQDPCLHDENQYHHSEQQQQWTHYHPHIDKPLSRRGHSAIACQLDMQQFLVDCR